MIGYIKEKINKKIREVELCNSMLISAAQINNKAFSGIKNICDGRELVLCGAGPSLAKYKPIENAVHIALNRALLFDGVHFDYFVADDWGGVRFIQDEVISYNCIKFLGHSGIDGMYAIPESFALKAGAMRYYTDCFMMKSGHNSEFVVDIENRPIGTFPNIGLQAMQIALYMNPKRIYIVGCDATKGHFVVPPNLTNQDIEVYEKGFNRYVSADTTIAVWKRLKDFSQMYYPDTEICSVNPVGLKGLFKDVFQ